MSIQTIPGVSGDTRPVNFRDLLVFSAGEQNGIAAHYVALVPRTLWWPDLRCSRSANPLPCYCTELERRSLEVPRSSFHLGIDTCIPDTSPHPRAG